MSSVSLILRPRLVILALDSSASSSAGCELTELLEATLFGRVAEFEWRGFALDIDILASNEVSGGDARFRGHQGVRGDPELGELPLVADSGSSIMANLPAHVMKSYSRWTWQNMTDQNLQAINVKGILPKMQLLVLLGTGAKLQAAVALSLDCLGLNDLNSFKYLSKRRQSFIGTTTVEAQLSPRNRRSRAQSRALAGPTRPTLVSCRLSQQSHPSACE